MLPATSPHPRESQRNVVQPCLPLATGWLVELRFQCPMRRKTKTDLHIVPPTRENMRANVNKMWNELRISFFRRRRTKAWV